MNTPNNDVRSIMPYEESLKIAGEALKVIIDRSFDGVAAFLGRICLPAAEELGFWFKDGIRHYRLNNVIQMLQKAEGKIVFNGNNLQIHPNIANQIIEHSSWQEDDLIQDLWSGLLISSCTSDGKNDDNLIFIDILKRLTTSEAKIIKYINEKSQKKVNEHNLAYAKEFEITAEKLIKLTNVQDIHRIDRELDHLRSMDLLGPNSGLLLDLYNTQSELKAHILLSNLCMNLYISCQGKRVSPAGYWDLKYRKEEKENNKAG